MSKNTFVGPLHHSPGNEQQPDISLYNTHFTHFKIHHTAQQRLLDARSDNKQFSTVQQEINFIVPT